MPATLATIDPLLKEVYRGQIREQLNQETIALKRIQSGSAGITNEIGGRYVTFPIHVSRNSGIGSRLESEALPAAGAQGTAAARTGLKYAYGGVQLTGQSIALTDSNPQAFAKALDFEMTNLKKDILKDMNRQVYGDGSGAISTITATATSATQTVADARLFQVGELVDVIATTGTAPALVYSSTISSGRTINSINLTNNTIVLDSSITGTVGNIVTRKGSGISASGNRELTGLAAIIATGNTIYNINPGTQPVWNANVFANGGTNRALSEGLMIQLIDQIRTQGGSTSLILTSLGVRRSYFNLLSQLRTVVNTQEFTGGFKGLAFTTDRGEVPFISDPDAPLNKMWFVNEDSFTFYRDGEWDWMDRQGSIWQQVRDTNGDYDAFYARLIEYHELGCDTRNSQGLLSDITES